MLLAWGITFSAFKMLPENERVEMLTFWRWKIERERVLRERHEMEMKQKAMQKRGT